jgi:hypothetical protein
MVSRLMHFLIFAFAVPSFSADTVSNFGDRVGYRYGAGIGVNRSGDFAQVEIMTPAFAEYPVADMWQKTGIVGFVGFHNVYNLTGDSETVTSQLFKVGLGLENRVTVVDKSRQAFSRIVPVYYSLRDRIFSKKPSDGFGVRLSFGMDFVLAENRSHWFGGDSSATYYVLFDLQAGLPRARVPGASVDVDVLNGLSIGAGIRNHF